MKKRVISAIIMIIIAIPLIIIGGIYFKIGMSILAIMSLYEFLKLRENIRKIPLFIKITSYLLIALTFILLNDYSSNIIIDYKIFPLLFMVLFVPIIFINDNNKYNINDALFVIGIILLVSVSFNGFVIIRNVSVEHFIYLLLISVLTDTFAYFGGRLIGKHKLCQKASPNKTIEGAISGSLVGTIVPVIFYILFINQSINFWVIISITLLFSVVGQLGDLFFSSIKREYNIKDFSKLIPGHGGILDRFDSLIFIALAYILFMNVI